MSIDEVRRAYAAKIGARSERLVKALAETPRERFVGPGPWTIAGGTSGTETPDADPVHLYQNVSVALDAARNLYNGAPGTLIPWIDALDLREGDRVFHLGGGTGYYTAIIASVVGRSGHVVMAEVDQTLGSKARELLQDVDVFVGDGGNYDPADCDVIFVNAGVTHPARVWLDRLTPGGRMLLPLTFEFSNSILGKGAMIKITQERNGFSAMFLPAPMVIYSCSSLRDPVLNDALLHAYSTRLSQTVGVRSVRVDRHGPDSSCWVHGDSFCVSTLQLS